MPLFNLTKSDLSDNQTPLKGAGVAVSQEGEQKGSVVNVVADYSWTLSPKSARADAPYIELIERRMTNNALLQQIYYYATVVTDTPQDILEQAESFITNTTGLNINQTDTFGDTINRIANETLENDPENPYDGLYALEDTGWVYVLPYFSNQNHSFSNAWENVEGTGVIGGVSNALFRATEGIAGDINMAIAGLGAVTGDVQAPVGTYIEKPKQFKFPGGGPSYNVTFNLYNTLSIEDVIRNWELCFLLVYQNLPNRRTKTIFDPPMLYEITIPGVRRSPVSYLNSIKVEFVGATRIMDLNVGGIGRNLRTIVPDAYRITLNVEDVFPESKNFYQGVLNDNEIIQISVDANEQSRREGLRNMNFDVEGTFGTEYNGITVIDMNEADKKGSAVIDKDKDIPNLRREGVTSSVSQALREVNV